MGIHEHYEHNIPFEILHNDCERTTSCYIFYLTNQMLCTLVCMIGVKLDGYIHGWGTQKECLTPKSLSKQYFEWPLHLQNNFFGRFFSIRFLGIGWLKHVLKCSKRWLQNYVPLHNFIKKDSILRLIIFVQIAPYFNHQ
jgi:hypothetical protein